MNTVSKLVWSDRLLSRLQTEQEALLWLDSSTDLILDSAAAGQLVAVTDGDYDGGLQEKGIPSLQKTYSQIIKKKANVSN